MVAMDMDHLGVLVFMVSGDDYYELVGMGPTAIIMERWEENT